MPASSNQPRRSLPLDFLKRLGLGRNCSVEEVREAFLRRAQETHPDHGGDKAAFRQLKQDYEEALHYASHPQRTTSARPHSATIDVRGSSRRTGKHVNSVKLLLMATGATLLGCYFAQSVLLFVLSLIALAVLTLLLAFLALPLIGRAYSTILFFASVGLSATFMIGLFVQGEYAQVYRTPNAEMEVYDWLIAASPFYFVLLWTLGFCGWSAAMTNSRRP